MIFCGAYMGIEIGYVCLHRKWTVYVNGVGDRPTGDVVTETVVVGTDGDEDADEDADDGEFGNVYVRVVSFWDVQCPTPT